MRSQRQQIDGQMLLEEWMDKNKPISVDIVGLCDDAVCPICGHEFLYPEENDRKYCPECGQRMNWDRWHYINDND